MDRSDDLKNSPEALFVEHGYGNRFQGFQNLMRLRVRDILLVSSLYDLYLFEEDGRLYELIRNEYQGLNLSHSPELTRVSSGKDAISLAMEESRFRSYNYNSAYRRYASFKFCKAGKKIRS